MNCFNILHINIRSLRNKYQELSHILSDYEISIFIIQETKLMKENKIVFPGFKTYSFSHPSNKPRGGTMIGIKNNINHRKVSFHFDNNNEYSFCRFDIGNQEICLHSIYNHPANNLDIDYIANLCTPGNHHIIAGDLNAKHKMLNSSSTNKNGTLLYDLLLNTDLIIANNKNYTHRSDISVSKEGNILDYFLISAKLYSKLKEFFVLEDIGSDHYPIVIKLDIKDYMTNKISDSTNLNYRKADWTKYRHYIQNHDDSVDTSSDVDTFNEQLTNLILQAAKTAIPPYKQTRPVKPLPDFIVKSIRTRRYYHREFIKTRDNEFKKLYNKQTNIIRKQIKDFNSKKC